MGGRGQPSAEELEVVGSLSGAVPCFEELGSAVLRVPRLLGTACASVFVVRHVRYFYQSSVTLLSRFLLMDKIHDSLRCEFSRVQLDHQLMLHHRESSD